MVKHSIFHSIKNENAYTLIEISMAIFLVIIIGAIVTGSFISGNHIKAKQEGVIEVQQNIRVALHLMSRELKMAGYEPGTNWNPGTLKTTNQVIDTNNDQTAITFSYALDTATDINADGNTDNPADIDGDGNLDNGLIATVTYSLLPDPNNANITSLARNVVIGATNTTQFLVPNINSLTFSYFNDNGVGARAWAAAPAAAPAFTLAVGITVVTQSTRQESDLKQPIDNKIFTDPWTGVAYAEPADRFVRRMSSTVVNLRNL